MYSIYLNECPIAVGFHGKRQNAQSHGIDSGCPAIRLFRVPQVRGFFWVYTKLRHVSFSRRNRDQFPWRRLLGNPRRIVPSHSLCSAFLSE